jgi:error-prone DNA polymerase
MFQVESRAQISFLPRMMPRTFYDIVVQVAIIRPGPIVGEMLHPYLRRREGREEAASPHPSLDDVLKRTLGVPLFQEQLLRMSMLVADFTGGEAEELRRAMGFKRSQERMADIEVRLRDGMTGKGIVGEAQDRIVQSITSFALYGFPESHAISFALIAYSSAYLKCHYLAAFTAAMLNNQPMGFYSPFTLVKDAQRHGLHFKPVDVTESEYRCAVLDKHTVRLGLNYVKGLPEQTALAIVAERAREPFSSIDDLARRTPVSRANLNALAELGALNGIVGREKHRRDALWQAQLALRPAGDLFHSADNGKCDSPLHAMSREERLAADLSNSGMTIGTHPVAFDRDLLNRMKVTPVSKLHLVRNGQSVRVAGLVICRQQPGTAKGFVFLSLEDETGVANVILNRSIFSENRRTILNNSFLAIEGIMQNHSMAMSVKARKIDAYRAGGVSIASHDFY